MVHHIITFEIKENETSKALKIINEYFTDLDKNGPAGMRSFCYRDTEDSERFILFNSFREPSKANKYKKSSQFSDCISKLSLISISKPLAREFVVEESFNSM